MPRCMLAFSESRTESPWYSTCTIPSINLQQTTIANLGAMPITVEPPKRSIDLSVQPLGQAAFAQFGTVIQNPQPELTPRANLTTLPPNAVVANQGSALKYLDVTHMLDLYGDAPSKSPSKAVMNMFVCAPRRLQEAKGRDVAGLFEVQILERHPFTTQTFVPLGLSPAEQKTARYLVVVAPSLSPSKEDESLPVPCSPMSRGTTLPGRGLPDLGGIKAFIATGSQAVTYGAGIWHAPMVAIGSKAIDFVVIQFANGVAIEDCQEALLEPHASSKIHVCIPVVAAAAAVAATSAVRGTSKL